MDADALQLKVPGSTVAMNERDGKAAILATAARMLRHLGESAFDAIGETIKAKRSKEKRMANARQTHGRRMANAWQRKLREVPVLSLAWRRGTNSGVALAT